jgi:hypothetical protein
VQLLGLSQLEFVDVEFSALLECHNFVMGPGNGTVEIVSRRVDLSVKLFFILA